jgi:hypothetical protein
MPETVLVEKLIVAQLLTNLFAFHSTRRIITVFARNHQNPVPCLTFRNILVPSPNPQAGGPPSSSVSEYLQLPATCRDHLLRPEPLETSHDDDSGDVPILHVILRSSHHHHHHHHHHFKYYEH